MSVRRAVTALAIACVLLAFVCGCGSKVSKANYDKIEIGMTEAQVEKILGKGTPQADAGGAIGNLAGSAKIVSWKDGDKGITVTFINGKVTLKAPQGL